jgi:hypothetical protein
MKILMLTLLIIFILVAIGFQFANRETKKIHAKFNKTDVIQALQNVLTGETHDEFDLFLGWPIDDPQLEGIRKECLDVLTKYPKTEPGKDISNEAEKWVKSTICKLKSIT